MGDVLHGLLDQLVVGIADDRAVPLVDAQVAAGGGVDVGDADGRVLERAAEPLLALAHRLLFPDALDAQGDLVSHGGQRLERRFRERLRANRTMTPTTRSCTMSGWPAEATIPSRRAHSGSVVSGSLRTSLVR